MRVLPKKFREALSPILRVAARPRNLYVLLAFVFVSGLWVLKTSWVSDAAKRATDYSVTQNDRVLNLFQTSFYFYYEDQFKPGIEEILAKGPSLTRVRLISGSGQVVFDSRDLGVGKTVASTVETRLAVHPNGPVLMEDPEGFGVLAPANQYTIYYSYSLKALHRRVLTIFIVGMALLAAMILFRSVFRLSMRDRVSGFLRRHLRIYSIRSKFIMAIVLLNVLTCVIVFISLSYVQKREQTERIMKESVLFSSNSSDNVISSFSNFFYFYYQDKFVPAVKRLISTNDNLMVVRIISRKANAVVFDSEEMLSMSPSALPSESKRSDITEAMLNVLKSEEAYQESFRGKDGKNYFRVVTASKNETLETPFLVEFVFSFARLEASVANIRRQILIDLIPSVAIGILVAIVFSQLVLGPLRRLVRATQAITAGNYDVNLDVVKKDELADLMRSFNSMAQELKRKNELRKYLSDQSYRRITEAQEGMTRLGGSRVRATVLFCDIRNFVSVCEVMDAEDVTSLLNEYFSSMVEVIYKHKGEVDKFIGDAILAVFYEQNEMRQDSNMALHAIYCAMEMRDKLQEFNAKRVRAGKPVIEIGVGINGGEIISGPIGSPDRMDFTVIGDVVNLASRIEKLSKQGRHSRIVFSNFVEERVRGLLEYEELTREKIRGKEEEITVYELIRVRDVQELLTNLNHPDPAIKRHSIELLGYSSNVNALPALFQKLSDSNEIVRIATISAITRLAAKDSAKALDVLFSQLEREDSVRVLSAIIVGVGRMCRNERLLKLVPFLKHRDERIIANTIEALSGSDDPKVLDMLIPFITSKNNRIKANAAIVLFSKGKVEVLEALKPMLMHSDATMRASAAFALGELTSITSPESVTKEIKKTPSTARQFLAELQSSVPLLVSLLRDADPMVKKQAVIALGKIKDKSAVLPLLENINFENDSREMVQEVAEALRSIGSHRLVREMVRQIV